MSGMNRSNIDTLHERFPLLFKQRVYPACGDGWFTLLYSMCAIMEPLLRAYAKGAEEADVPCISDIKEKYGTLRFYADNETDVMSTIISVAESMSHFICEVCGQPGKVRDGGWVKTRCDKCFNGREDV